MNKSQRIYLNTGETSTNKYFKIKLEQDVDSLEFLSMNVYTKDVYQDFNADYGVLIGRVIANGGVGIPNAKISIFIPLTDEDAQDGTITSIYPYKTPRDVNYDGKRYNLLPRVSQYNETKKDFSPKQPFGSFPTKPEIVTNQSFLDVYKKYYKYTTITNGSGDYMIFGVPVGTQTVHLSVDITDIGEYSMTPAAMVKNLGYSPSLFYDNNTRIKSSNDLNDLPNIETQEISVDILPFWGDVQNFEIGITRQDFRIRAKLEKTFVIFGSAFTDGDNSTWGSNFYDGIEPRIGELYRLSNDGNANVGIGTKRTGIISEKIYFYPSTISDSNISAVNPIDKMVVLDKSEYTVHKRNGDFVFIINCNRKKIITNEAGYPEEVDDNSPNGVYTEFKGFVTFEITSESVSLPSGPNLSGKAATHVMRYKLKFPQYANYGQSLDYEYYDNGWVNVSDNNAWRKQYYTFTGNGFYSISKFHGTVWNDIDGQNVSGDRGFITNDYVNYFENGTDPFWLSGIIVAKDVGDMVGNNQYQFPAIQGYSYFGANWLNLTMHLPQFSGLDALFSKIDEMRASTAFRTQQPSDGDLYRTYNGYFLYDNTQPIAAGDTNTVGFARSDLNWTDFINVPIPDIRAMNKYPTKGFVNQDFNLNPLQGKYHGGQTKPTTWPTANAPTYITSVGDPKTNNGYKTVNDSNVYFYKGFGNADCISYLFELGLLTEE